MSKKTKVTKIVIRIGEQDAELTIEQARQLKAALNELLGTKETVYIPQPYIVERLAPYHYPYWSITWGGETTVTNTNKWTGGTVTYSLVDVEQ